MTGVPVCAGLLASSLVPLSGAQAAHSESALRAAAPLEHVSAASASSGGRVGPASALTFTNRTTADGLGSDYVTAVHVTDDTVYVGTSGGLSTSTDGGVTFTNDDSTSGLGSDTVLSVYATDDTVYVGTLGGLSISTDGGASFNTRSTLNSGLADDWVFGVYAVGSKVYAATFDGLSISVDGGASFTTALSPMRVWSVFAVDDTVYAGTDNAGLRISSNGGATFPVDRRIADGLAADGVRSVYAVGSTVYTGGTQDFFTSGTGGVSISTDGGATFSYDDSRSGLGSDEVYSVYVTGGTIYAATRGGLSLSSDGGATYTNYSTGNSSIGSNEVLDVFARGGVVYAATDNGLSISGSSSPVLNASPTSTTVVAGATTTVTVSSTALALADDTVIAAASSAPAVATVTPTVNPSGGAATFTISGVTAGTANVTFSATGYANVVVPVTVTAPSPGPGPGPAPPVTSPPSAPLSVSGVAGDGSAVLSWAMPASSGSFPVTDYQAVVSPGGQSCLVNAPELTCTVTGLTNGTAYTATVRALNGAGWGPYSAAAATFTPQLPVTPSITITGTRGEVRGKPGVVVTGTTTDFDIGAILRPWIRFPGQTSYTQGTASILVDIQGGFTWERRTGKTIYISIRSEDGAVVSNRLILRTT